jgi:hypothetical protein
VAGQFSRSISYSLATELIDHRVVPTCLLGISTGI